MRCGMANVNGDSGGGGGGGRENAACYNYCGSMRAG